MGVITYSTPTPGQPNSTEDPKTQDALQKLLTLQNGNLDKNNLAAAAGVLKLTSLANRTAAFGSVSVPFSGSVYNAGGTGPGGTIPVAHGLGAVPVFAVASLNWGDGFASVVSNSTTTNIYIVGHSVIGATTGTFTCWWLAIA